MSDVNCPYCGYAQEINHDDGYGYEEDRDHTQYCPSCQRSFGFTTSISYNYEVFCDGDHEMEHCGHDDLPNFYECVRCDYYEIRE